MATQQNPLTFIPPKLLMAARPILEAFPGIWYMTPRDNSIIICASNNYADRLHGEWYPLPSTPIEGGLVIHWLVAGPTSPGVWYMTDEKGIVITRSSNYKSLEDGLWHTWSAPSSDGYIMHWALRFA
jgi:hypothetical protein